MLLGRRRYSPEYFTGLPDKVNLCSPSWRRIRNFSTGAGWVTPTATARAVDATPHRIRRSGLFWMSRMLFFPMEEFAVIRRKARCLMPWYVVATDRAVKNKP